MNYENLTDIEINARVSHVLYGDVSRGHQMELASDDVEYCNRVEDAWPIIVANRISTAFDSNTAEWFCWGDFEFDQGGWDMITEPAIFHSNYNPLRAAMIVFLKMQEKA